MRLTIIDLIKAVAAQLIVLHHLVAYGPLSVALEQTLPELVHWLFNDARMAVQAFLVMGGYLAAGVLAKTLTQAQRWPWDALANRYLRLVLPFMAAVLLTVACTALAGPWLGDDAMLSAPPGIASLLAHATLLHGVLGIESLSAGVWYVAIDFQLFALLLLLLWLCRRDGKPVLASAMPAIVLLTLLSLFWFNRHAALDNYAIYFFGAYGMGVLACWMGQWQKPLYGIAMLAALGIAANLVDYRERIVLATLIAMLLLWTRHVRGADTQAGVRIAAYFGRTSYALFLIHFSLCLLGNAVFAHYGGGQGGIAIAAALGIWLAANLAAHVFYRWVEAPATRLRSQQLLARLRQAS